MSVDNFSSHKEIDNSINIRAEIETYLVHWLWYVIGVVFCVVIGYLYNRYTKPQYNATSTILIKNDKKGGISEELAAFKELGGLGSTNKNIENEIQILKSRKIIGDVVKSMNLNVTYLSEGRIKINDIYKNSPIRIDFIKKDSSLYSKKDTIFYVKVLNQQEFSLIDIDEVEIGTYKFANEIKSIIGDFKVLKTNNNEGLYPKVKVIITPLYRMIDKYKNLINISPVNKNASVLNISLKDEVGKRAEDIIDELVRQYNKDAILDKNQVSEKTKRFIDARLDTIGKDLSLINNSLKDYKVENKLTDIEVESQFFLKAFSANNEKLIQKSIQLKLVLSVYKDLINNNTDSENLLASNLGFEDVTIANAIKEYNKLVLQKRRLLKSASKLNPQIVLLTNQIDGIRHSLIQSLENTKNSLELTLRQLEAEDKKIKDKISNVPNQELKLKDIKLQQEIIASLYSYLLKKKEETEISLAVAVSNAKVIDKAYSTNNPVSPKKNITYLIAFLFGITLPTVLIYLKNILDTKIHNKADVEENISVPFLADVPKSDSREKIVIESDARSSTAEAFRLIRTNLDFMLANIKGKSKTIFVTSTTSGEGKSFISINVAASLALSGKRVLLMGMDLRAPKVTEYLGIPDRKGVTNYITDNDLDLESLIFNIDNIKNLDIISSGVVPPNPAELLMTKRTENLFTIIKEEYDYVVVDTAPVNLVTDTLLISKYADMFIYIARANYLDKRLLAIPQTLYNEKRLPNMAMVLNDTDPKRSYGYGYGGYGYGYVVEEKPWYKKILNR